VIDIADILERDPAEVAIRTSDGSSGPDGLLTAVSRWRDDRWHSLARLAIRDDIYGSFVHCASTCWPLAGRRSVSRDRGMEHTNSSRVARARRTLADLRPGQHDLATLSVAAGRSGEDEWDGTTT
jgi:glutamate dehydrogenase